MKSETHTLKELQNIQITIGEAKTAFTYFAGWRGWVDRAIKGGYWSGFELASIAAPDGLADGSVFLRSPLGIVRLCQSVSHVNGKFKGRWIIERVNRNGNLWEFTEIHYFPMEGYYFGFSEGEKCVEPLVETQNDYRKEERMRTIGAIISCALLNSLTDIRGL